MKYVRKKSVAVCTYFSVMGVVIFLAFYNNTNIISCKVYFISFYFFNCQNYGWSFSLLHIPEKCFEDKKKMWTNYLMIFIQGMKKKR